MSLAYIFYAHRMRITDALHFSANPPLEMTVSNQTRYTMLLDGPTVSRLNVLQKSCSLPTRAAVFDLAVSVLDWMVQQQLNGYEVGRSKGENNFQPLLLPVPVVPVVASVDD